MKKKIIILGASGQLGKEFKYNKEFIKSFSCSFYDRNEIDISKISELENIFKNECPQFVINCAAYTAVDNAEDDQENAFLVNSYGPKLICEEISKYGSKLLHISTDFVFNGKNNFPYRTDHKVDPLSIYGKSKAEGEKHILKFPNNIILRTSWLYGDKGNNFFNTIFC